MWLFTFIIAHFAINECLTLLEKSPELYMQLLDTHIHAKQPFVSKNKRNDLKCMLFKLLCAFKCSLAKADYSVSLNYDVTR